MKNPAPDKGMAQSSGLKNASYHLDSKWRALQDKSANTYIVAIAIKFP